MKAQHTPGPWANIGIGFDTEIIAGVGSVDPLKVVRIATVYDCSLSMEVQEANAHLIAAAPDLLAALELVAGLDEGMLTSPTLAVVKNCRAAIAKAKGE